MLAPGSRLGPYAIDSLLGTGGMGEVYRARDTRLDRLVNDEYFGDGLTDELITDLSRIPNVRVSRHFARQATTGGFQKALQCFQEATELDPNADAHKWYAALLIWPFRCPSSEDGACVPDHRRVAS